jgi:hypothetical protein
LWKVSSIGRAVNRGVRIPPRELNFSHSFFVYQKILFL